MLNRTNRTLSAHLNRLNLGTRSLAIVAGVNNGTSPRFRLYDAFHLDIVVVRAEVPFVSILPSMPPIMPKPIGESAAVFGRKRDADLGSSSSTLVPATGTEARHQGLLTRGLDRPTSLDSSWYTTGLTSWTWRNSRSESVREGQGKFSRQRTVEVRTAESLKGRPVSGTLEPSISPS